MRFAACTRCLTRGIRACANRVYTGGRERQSHPLDGVKASLPPLFVVSSSFHLLLHVFFFVVLAVVVRGLLSALPIPRRLAPIRPRRVGGGRQLAYSRDQSGGTRATGINDHQAGRLFPRGERAINRASDASSTPAMPPTCPTWPLVCRLSLSLSLLRDLFFSLPSSSTFFIRAFSETVGRHCPLVHDGGSFLYWLYIGVSQMRF